MGSYLQTYGVDEERRGRIVKRIVAAVLASLVIALIAYLIFHNWPERQKVKRFLADVNAHNYQAAYEEWGCSDKTPCPNYDFRRFSEDWASPNVHGAWSVESSDSCKTFLTVNVQAPGSELESLAVQRSDNSLGFAPAPECQERKWRWGQFFNRLLGKTPPPPRPAQ